MSVSPAKPSWDMMRWDRAALAKTPNPCALHFGWTRLPAQDGNGAEEGIKACKEKGNLADVTWDLPHECIVVEVSEQWSVGSGELTERVWTCWESCEGQSAGNGFSHRLLTSAFSRSWDMVKCESPGTMRPLCTRSEITFVLSVFLFFPLLRFTEYTVGIGNSVVQSRCWIVGTLLAWLGQVSHLRTR